ncbi:MAG: hypothetical protein EPO26_06760 [Chloroflexota bacterium]|nr:MAG: hypothetical protein EPO26_06760 [Chloroflexota bacterium]
MIVALARELVLGSRRGAPYALLLANGILMAGVAAALNAVVGTVSPWVAPSIGATPSSTPSGVGPMLVAWRGPALFILLCAWLTIMGTIFAPVIGARAIGADRRTGALDDLIGSGTRVESLVAAKLLAVALQSAMIVASGLPAFALVWLLGGVAATTAVSAALVIASWLLLLGALGLVSSSFSRGDVAPAAAGGVIGATLLIAPIVTYLLFMLTDRTGGGFIVALSPLAAILAANPEFADALGKVAPIATSLPVRVTISLPGAVVGGPLPLVSAGFYVLLSIALVPVVALTLDPMHRLKTIRLRYRPAD